MAIATLAQFQALKINILANTSTVLINGAPVAINVVPPSPDNGQQIANWYSQIAAPDFWVLRTNIGVDEIENQVTWANYTPNPAPDGTVLWGNCSLCCQGKQFNLQLLLPPGSLFNAALILKRAGLNDATTKLPSGTPLGTLVSGGWANILPILIRKALIVEKLFAIQTSGVGVTSTDALGLTTNPALMQVEGTISGSDVLAAWSS